MKALSGALKVNETLRELNLFYNKLENCSEGVKLLLESLKINTSLERLQLGANDLDGSVLTEMSNLLDRNKHNNPMKNSCLFGLLLPILHLQL